MINFNWQPIVTMAGHSHGLYLCLIKCKQDGHYVAERYFTYSDYSEGRRATFESDEQAKDVVAFMIPRFFPCGEDDFITKVENKIKVIQKEGKPNKKFRRLCTYIQNLNLRMSRS